MEYTLLIKRHNIFNNSRIYFELQNIDTHSTKFVNIDAYDYTKLEKAYIKNIAITIKYLNTNQESSIIGNVSLTCFDLHEAISDKVDIEELLDAEGEDTYNIYSTILNNFNKEYYDYFGYSNERNIANITSINIKEEYSNINIYSYIIKNIAKVTYHLLGIKISTILIDKQVNRNINLEDSFNLLTKVGFLEIDNEYDFMAKNIDIHKQSSDSLNRDELNSKEELVYNFKELLSKRELVKDILEGNNKLHNL